MHLHNYDTFIFVQQIPENLNFELILGKATQMYKQFDLSNVKEEVDNRAILE